MTPPTALQIIAVDCARLAMDLEATPWPAENWATGQLAENMAPLARRVARLAEILHETGGVA